MQEFQIEIPQPIENKQLPNPELLQYYRNLIEDRIIWIDFEIDDSLLDVVKQIIQINKDDKNISIEDRKPIKICIFSYGGNIDSTFTFLDICKLSKTPIITINFGVAISAGLLIFLAGHKRYTLSKSQFLIHSGSGGTNGTFEQTESQMANYKKMVDTMRNYILERTAIDLKLFNKNKSKEWYIYPDTAIELKICDKIIDDIDDII